MEIKNTIEEKIKRGRDFFLDILFPTKCVGCGKEGKYLCDDCDVFISESFHICPICRTNSFSGKTHEGCNKRYGLDGIVNIWEYEGIIGKIIRDAKYEKVFDSFKELTEKSFKIMVKNEARFSDFLEILLNEKTLITYVPIFKKKELKRGFNQSQFLAKEIGGIINRKEVCLLEKIKDTGSQTKLDKKERFENVRGSFSLSKNVGRNCQGNVVLVDDIWTTGATINECCKTLKEAGFEKVWGFTLARTV